MKNFLSPFASAYQSPTWFPTAFVQPLLANSIFPKNKLDLGRFPTPVHDWNFSIPSLPSTSVTADYHFYLKRDDLSSFDLSGNKVRKLEFLLAEATEGQYDCVITIGGVQSNHCRATAVAARQLGLDPYLILRKPSKRRASVSSSSSEVVSVTEVDDTVIDLTGNLLLDRMVNSQIRTVSASQYAQYGSDNLCHKLAEELRAAGRNPYVIPVGGSNTRGAFGYMQCVDEILQQQQLTGKKFDHIVFGCGSGGTAAGLAIGCLLSGMCTNTKLHAVGVCDSPDYFYNHIDEVASDLYIKDNESLRPHYDNLKDWCFIYPGQGIGYARSTPSELQFIVDVSTSSGILLDPVYSGKAFYHFINNVISSDSRDSNGEQLFKKGQNILFIHTGGTLGLYDKTTDLLPLLPQDQVKEMTL